MSPTFAGPGTSRTEGAWHLREIFRVLLDHWKLTVVFTALVTSATYYSSKREIPEYQSKLALQINSPKQVQARQWDDIDIDELAIKTDPVLSEAMVLRTQNLAYRVVDSLGLMLRLHDPETRRPNLMADVHVNANAATDDFELKITPGGWELLGARGGFIAKGGFETPVSGPGFSFRVLPYHGDALNVSFGIISRGEAADFVRNGLDFEPRPNTNAVDVTYTGTDPVLVPQLLNRTAIELRQNAVERTLEVSERRVAYITNQLILARSSYDSALAAIQGYKERASITDLTTEERGVLAGIQDVDQQRQRMLMDVAMIRDVLTPRAEVTIETLNRLAAVPALASNSAVAFQITNLLTLQDERHTLVAGTLGMRENNPSVQALDQRIEMGTRALLQAAEAAARSLEDGAAGMERRVREFRARLSSLPGAATQFAQLAMQGELHNDVYKFLLTEEQRARIAHNTIAPYIEVLDPATEALLVGMAPNRKVILGLIVGLFLGAVLGFFLEYLDQTIRTAADVERALGIPVLGVIPYEPHLIAGNGRSGNGGRRRSLPLVSLASPDDPTAEAYRALRTNVTFVSAGEQRPVQLITVTSAGPGEGKTTTAANLAITMAQQGARTLLVDADLRRPLLHRAFNLVQEPGLTDILVNTASAREAVRPLVVPQLDVLPAGALPPNPSELLGSATMSRILTELRATYDLVVFDTPPVLAVTDAAVLGILADAVILVVRAGETEEIPAQRAVAQLQRVKVRVAGAVLNGAEKERQRYYDYYAYYRRGRVPRMGRLGTLRERVKSLLT